MKLFRFIYKDKDVYVIAATLEQAAYIYREHILKTWKAS